MTTLEEVLFNEARRQVEQQASEFEALRSRAITVLGVGGVVAGLFVRSVNHLDVFGWMALVLYLLSVIAAVVVVVPWRQFAFSENLRTSMAWYREHGSHPQALNVYLVATADNLRQDRDENQKAIRLITLCFAGECALLGLQLLLWVLSAAVS